MRRLVTCIATCLATACGGSGLVGDGYPLSYGPANPADDPGPAYGLIGDWFLCFDASCAGLAPAGFRFTDDGLVYGLEADDEVLTTDGTYCVDRRPEEVVLIVTASGWQLLIPGSGMAELAPTGQPDVMVLRAEEVTWLMKRVWPPRADPRCDSPVFVDDPIPVPTRAGEPPGP